MLTETFDINNLRPTSKKSASPTVCIANMLHQRKIFKNKSSLFSIFYMNNPKTYNLKQNHLKKHLVDIFNDGRKQ